MALKPFFKMKTVKPKEQKGVQIDYDRPGNPYCKLCGLDKKVRSPRIGVTGEGRKKILAIPEGPGKNEDIKALNLVGEAGQAYESELKKVGIDLHKDLWTINSINCRPTEGNKNRKPTNAELQYCRPMWLKAIETLRPEYIWILGGVACDTFFMDRFQRRGINRWRKWAIPDRKFNAWVIPMYHPSNLVRQSKDPYFLATFRRDLKFAINQIGIPFPEEINFKSQIKCLYDIKEIEDRLYRIYNLKLPITIDYEATGIKPFKPNHHIRTISVDDGKISTPFPYDNPYWKKGEFEYILKPMWIQILLDPRIRKTAHHIQFEDLWSRVKHDLNKIEGWEFCTLQTAHVLDDRKGVAGLKFQGFVRFGIWGYGDKVSHYLKTEDKSIGYNDIDNCPLDDLLLYNGFDTIVTRELRKTQENILSRVPILKKANSFWKEGALALTNMQVRGIGADEVYYEGEKRRLTRQIDWMNKKMSKSEEAIVFKKKTGKTLNINSSKDLRELLFNIFKHKSVKSTKGGKESTDVYALEEIGSPFVNMLLRQRKLIKTRDTYLAQFLREVYNDRIHPFFGLSRNRTYRGNSSDPNFQNVPVRDEGAKKSTRQGIMPSQGFRLTEHDYGSQEVRILACYTLDPILIEYVEDEDSDMHRDCASDIFLMTQKQVSELIRFYGKNNWTFPEFYGSWYEACALNLWSNVVEAGLLTEEGETVKDHLRSRGIVTLSRFIDHCKKYERDFWNRFRVSKKWQEKVLKTYLEKGYVEMFTGFRRQGWLKKNEVINTPIQGTAFHCLLWSAIQLDYTYIIEEWNSAPIAQIHDCEMFDMDPEEQNMIIETIEQVATVDIRKHWSWLIVPLTMEHEFSPIDGSWYDKEKVIWNEDQKDWIGKKSGFVYDQEY